MTRSPHILIVSSIDISLLRFRGRLIETLVDQGFRVTVVAPEFHPDIRTAIVGLGAEVIEVPMSRSGISPGKDWATYRALKRLIREKSVDLVFPYTIKPVMYASLAARNLGVSAVGLVNGLGYVFTGNSPRQRLLRLVITPIYRFCVAKNKAMVFQNRDDLQYYLQHGILHRLTDTHVVSGSGVDLTEFPWREPGNSPHLRFCFVARLLVEKGINLYLEAAREIKKICPEAEFHVFGEPQPNSPNTVTAEALQESINSGDIVYHGRVTNIAQELSRMDVIVCPSWYREGIPRSLLEALSIGLAVITTDSPGCREVVISNKNGWIIQPRDTGELIQAISKAISSAETIADMSRESRKLAEARFDVKIVNAQLMEVFYAVMNNSRTGKIK